MFIHKTLFFYIVKWYNYIGGKSMAYQTLYRKYRPGSFELVYGQDAIVKTLKNVVKNDKLSHAYLFTGPRGTGKTSCAKLFAKTINCLNNVDGDACNECDSCKSFNDNSNPDIIEIDAASNNGVDEIRELKNKINLVPAVSKYKTYIIDEVHMLSIGAFNALLKTLEEPPKYVIFILATTEPQKLPITVISRCQRFDFKSISNDQMKKCLENIVKEEKIKIDSEAIDEIIINANGGMRDAIGMLDQAFAFCDKKITVQDIQELSGSISNKEITNYFIDVINKNYEKVIKTIKSWYEKGKDFSIITQKLIDYIRKAILYKKNIKQNITIEEDFYKKCSEKNLYFIIDSLMDLLSKIQINTQKQLVFEVEMIKLMENLNENKLNIEKKEENVSRETLEDEKKNDVPRETSNTQNNSLTELKKIRINNILLDSSRQELMFVKNMWENFNEYLVDEKYKKTAGMLVDTVPVAASNKGIIVTVPGEPLLKKIEGNYEQSKELIRKVLNNDYKTVYITEDYWFEIRPEYVKKVKNKELTHIDEEEILKKVVKERSNTSVTEFSDLIEMEEK